MPTLITRRGGRRPAARASALAAAFALAAGAFVAAGPAASASAPTAATHPDAGVKAADVKAASVATAGVKTAAGHAAAAAQLPPTWSGKPPPLATPWTYQVSPTNARPEYPRPQLARPSLSQPRWLSLNGLWQYSPTDGFSAPPVGRDLNDRILVPYPEESVLSGVQKHSDFAFYRRVVTLPKGLYRKNEHLRLNFGAVNYDATVYVNGTQVARHLGGYDAFSVDVTGALRNDGSGPQEIVVAVHSPVDSATIPVGKQRLNPGGIFYTASSGIWQSVWLEPVSETSIASLDTTADLGSNSLRVTPAINGPTDRAQVTVAAYAGNREVASATASAGSPLTLSIAKPHLWTPDDPFLYTLKASLKGHGSKDAVESYAAMRTIAVSKVDGRQRIVLNGKPTFLLATLDQGYWPDGIYTAPTDAGLKFDIQKTKDLGFNTIRKHIKVEPARWYYWADKLGMMVWQDIPALPTGRNDRLTTGDKAEFRDETRRIVDQLKGVPSIIGWIPFNEGWGQWSVPAATEVGAQVKAQDPSRLVDERSGANCCDTPGDPGTGDIIDWHQYTGPALPAPDATRASIDGEHGGFSLGIEGHTWPGASINPYGSVADRAALNDAYVKNTAVLRDEGAPYGLSGSVYTQITDVENELNGLFTYDRQVEKVDEARVRDINQQVLAAGSQPAPTPPAGTPGISGIDHWTFNEGSGTTAADSAGSNPLTLLNGAGWTAGKAGSALALNGSNQFASAGKPLLQTTDANYSVSAWVKLNQAGGAFQTIASQDGAATSVFFLQYSGADRTFAFSFANVRALASIGTPNPGQWYHLVGVRDIAAGTLKIYVDGKLSGSVGVLGNSTPTTGDFVIGRGRFDSKPVDFLNGAVDDTRIYDRAISADEVATLYAGGAAGIPSAGGAAG